MDDLRSINIEDLTNQQISSRIHLANDYLSVIETDKQCTLKMIQALVNESDKRKGININGN